MYIKQTTQQDIDTFKPAYGDLLEAAALGIEPQFPEPKHCVSLVDHWQRVIAIGGNEGDRVWFVTSELIDSLSVQSKREFRRVIMEYRDTMLKTYGTIFNYVYVGNHAHIRFLKSIGAVFHNEFCADGKFQLFTIGGIQCAGQQESL